MRTLWPGPASEQAYIVVLDWRGGEIVEIRDYRYARYATEGADVTAGP